MTAAADWQPVFIIGSPRSGTTLLGEILDHHPQVAYWYEPYFVLDHFHRDAPDDVRSAAHATPRVKSWLNRRFAGYAHYRRRPVVLDKSPRNSLKIPFLLKVFPNGRFVHILRDGRDTTLSIHREWQKRRGLIDGEIDVTGTLGTIKTFLQRQPRLTDRVAALQHEFGDIAKLVRHRQSLAHRRWDNMVGWGPRPVHWREDYARLSLIEFNATQWASCVNAVFDHQPQIPHAHFLQIRYEDLLADPAATLGRIFDFLALPHSDLVLERMPALRTGNTRKWGSMDAEDLQRVSAIVDPVHQRMGYAG